MKRKQALLSAKRRVELVVVVPRVVGREDRAQRVECLMAERAGRLRGMHGIETGRRSTGGDGSIGAIDLGA